MIRLALEWSSPLSSLAVERDGEVVAHAAEEHERFRARHALGMVKDLLAQAECGPEDLGEILVGRGPGNYSGMRMALTIATGLALPGGIPVTALSSGRALAFRQLSSDSSPVRIAGDARRGSAWTCRTDDVESIVAGPVEWQLVPMDALMTLDQDAPIRISSERDRLPESECWKLDYPDAVDLLNLRSRPGFVCEKADPLYLQPPV